MKIHVKTGAIAVDGSLNEACTRIGSHLFCRRMLNGQPDSKYTLFLNKANLSLLNRRGYIGLAPCGSRFKGYANGSSDFDVLLIADDGRIGAEGNFRRRLNGIAR